jgi:hemerythrin
MLYKWSEKFELGVRTIDEQHKCIFDLANTLHETGARSEGRAIVETVILEMGSYVDEHFEEEEALMEELHYPGLEEHRLVHQEMQAKVRGLAERFEAGEVEPPEVHFLVVSWLLKHITQEDLRIGEFIRDGQKDAA